MTCPLCGSPVGLDGFHVDLNSNTIVVGSTAVKVPPSEAEIAYILADKSPAFVSRNQLIVGLYGGSEPGNAERCLSVFLTRLRKTLAGVGYVIEWRYKRGVRLARISA